LESRAFSVEEICRWFRVDPALVGHGQKDSNWGTGLEQKMIWFLMFTLRPWLTRIEQAISKDLLTPAERLRYYPKFNVEGLLRADSKARASFYGVMVDKGILTRDEVRALEDRAPMGGNAAKLTVQSAMTTLDSLGAGSTPSADLRNALRNLLGTDDAPAPPGGWGGNQGEEGPGGGGGGAGGRRPQQPGDDAGNGALERRHPGGGRGGRPFDQCAGRHRL